MKDTKSIEGLKDAMKEIKSQCEPGDKLDVMIAWGESLVEYLEAGHQLDDLSWFQEYPADLQQVIANEKS